MERLIEYAGHHSLLAAAAVLAALIVIAYEVRARAQSVAAASPQEVIRLMNQNALVLDIRSQAKGQAHRRVLRERPARGVRGAATGRAGIYEGVQSARRP
jgi:hypothetical protein